MVEDGKIRKAEQRRARAHAAMEKSSAKLVRLMVDKQLKNDPEHIALLAQERDLRDQIHKLRLGSTKKRSKVTRLLQISFELSEMLKTLHGLEARALEDLDRLRHRIVDKHLAVTRQVVTTGLGSGKAET